MRLRKKCIAVLAGGFFLASSAADAATIFSNFGPGDTFDTVDGWIVSGPTSVSGIAFAPAMPFTSPVEADVTQIHISVVNDAGTNTLATVSLFTNASGALGTMLGSWIIGLSNNPGSSTIFPVSGVHLNAGGHYFLQASATGDADDGWSFNSIGQTGTILDFRSDEGFVQQDGTLGVFSLTGDITAASDTPLPATLPLFAGSLGTLGLLGWRRKRKAATAHPA